MITQKSMDRKNILKANIRPTLLFAATSFILMSAQSVMDHCYPEGTANDVQMTLYYCRYVAMLAGYFVGVWGAKHFVGRPEGVRSKLAAALIAGLFTAGMLLMLFVPVLPLYAVCMLGVTVLIGRGYSLVMADLAMRGEKEDSAGFVIGCGGAAAVLVHWVLHGLLPSPIVLSILISVSYYLMLRGLTGYDRTRECTETLQLPPSSDGTGGTDTESPVGTNPARAPENAAGVNTVRPRELLTLLVIVSGLLALFPFYEVYLNSLSFALYFYGWQRLLLMAGYPVIGFAFARGGRRAASLVVLCLSLSAVVYTLLMQEVQGTQMPTVLFYLLLGSVIAYSALAFLKLAPSTRKPALWASMGRILDSAVGLLFGLFAWQAALSPIQAAMINLAILAVVIIAMTMGGYLAGEAGLSMPVAEDPGEMISEKQHAGTQTQGNRQADHETRSAVQPTDPKEKSPSTMQERLDGFLTAYPFTPREQEVLKLLVTTDKKNQEIADEIFVSRRQLQNHIASIYEKTGTKTRAGLLLLINEEKS